MHRIDTPSRQKDKFGAGKDGFTQGDPQTGTQATQISEKFLDSIQEEIASVIEDTDSGATLDKSKNNQLVTAIKSIIRSAGMVATELARGAVKLANQMQADAGTADDVVLTPKKARNGFTMVTTTGAMALRLPTFLGSWMFQAGAGVPTSGIANISFPISYPDANSYVAIFGHRQSAAPTGLQSTVIDDPFRGAGSVRVKQFYFDSNGIIPGQSAFFWFTFGRGA